mmetsp:Transcript_2446/g.5691  ORF Transcript_2446/g.5691 Transcript_2446/m.5691 type:complete len:91 (+) Transcript_2446:155-427(+)|eukprot:CAMPEP_0178994460 /NCGR_PEP_ID=MMETSP0795-20121207/7282_1 /TAXON_ID=88552 /ORGANISM="Amoebophrya sp., Strain Ameob2" /LENGTH=90 /DNA_ID=CAMNT_0020686655 /DNA_START=83 /DNA_END=355 /DNA_ORIENTATION=-
MPPSPSADAFAKQAKNLTTVKKADRPENKKPAGHDPAMLKGLEDLYAKNKGDLAALAKATKSSETLMKKNPPKDGKEFAKKMLDGAYALN